MEMEGPAVQWSLNTAEYEADETAPAEPQRFMEVLAYNDYAPLSFFAVHQGKAHQINPGMTIAKEEINK
jgi:hypothetical protein